MYYHAGHRHLYDFMQILGDGFAFRDVEEIWPIFKEEPCNVRLSFVVDGVNPFRELITNYSVLTIFVINNNLPLWIKIKMEHIMLALIVPCTYFTKC